MADETKWYPVRLSAGATRLTRDRYVEVGKFGGRHLRSIAGEVSVVEKACEQADIQLHLPIIRMCFVNHITKKPDHKQIPMFPGFAFVADVTDFDLVEQTDGIAEVLRVGDEPAIMSKLDVWAIECAERQAIREFHMEWAKANLMVTKLTKKQMRKAFPKGKQIRIQSGIAAGYGVVKDVTTRNTIKVIHDKLVGMVEVPLDDVELPDYLVA